MTTPVGVFIAAVGGMMVGYAYAAKSGRIHLIGFVIALIGQHL